MTPSRGARAVDRALEASVVGSFTRIGYHTRRRLFEWTPLESLGLELVISHYWSSLNAEAERVKKELGALPDSHAPEWQFMLGGRYSIGYGKLMIGGLGGAIHFEPQAFLHIGGHAHDGDAGPSGDGGLGLLVFLTPKMFVRIDAAIVYEREDRSGQTVAVWGTLPSLGMGGTL